MRTVQRPGKRQTDGAGEYGTQKRGPRCAWGPAASSRAPLRLGLRRILAGAVAAAAFLLSGCSMGADVEGLMRPPRTTGEQEAIQSALEDYLGSASGYTLKYPQSGEYRSAFIRKDLNGDGQEEALAFYQPGAKSRNVHINMLLNTDEGWRSISDVEGPSTDVEEVLFGDLNADGILEVFVGWNIYNVSDRQLTLYSLTDGTFTAWYEGLYSSLLVGDMTADGRDDLLVLQSGTAGESARAALWSVVQPESGDAVLSEIGTAALDTTIQEYRTIQTCPLSDAVTGIYIDAVRTAGGLVTELLYWDGLQLLAPFHDESTGLTQLTYRDAGIPSMDVDGDGQVEWPSCTMFPGTEDQGRGTPWKTDWMSWDYESGTSSRKFSSVVNLRDGYLLRLDDSWEGMISADYDREEGILSLYDIRQGQEEKQEILALRTIPAVRRTTDDEASASTTTASTAATTGAETSATAADGPSAGAGMTEDAAMGGAAGSANTASEADGEKTAGQERRRFESLEKKEDGTVYEVWYSTEEPFLLSMEYIRYMFIFLS